jgi:[protein-PII] uridylyltransferase
MIAAKQRSKLAILQEQFLASGDAITLLAERTAQVDQIILESAWRHLFPALPADVALLAVGGYGRRQLFPYSDIDLLLLFESERLMNSSKEIISTFLQELWDAGLRMSHSVRTTAECTEVHDHNTELNVSLLDQRFLGGDRVLYATLAAKLPRFVHGNRDALVRNLGQLTRDRHGKYAGTFYHLEPNVKETPGGLRDYQLICWLQQLRETEPSRLAGPEPAPELREAFHFLARLRCYLHCQSGRDNNALSFDAQDAIAEQWSHTDAAHWMRDYYRHARAVSRAALRGLETAETEASSLFSQLRDWRSRIGNAEFSVHRERVSLRSPQQLETEPEVALRLYEFVARHGVRASDETVQRVEARRNKLRDHFKPPQTVWPSLQAILGLPYAPLAIREMHESGLLTAIFPELENIECLVVRDFYHRYTVDEHTLVTLQNLWALRDETEGPLRSFRDLLAEVKDPAPLACALLFHDSGKSSGENHVEPSARLAAEALSRIRMPDSDRETVLFLIRKHLTLSNAMQSRDLFDPQTLVDVAHQVETVERLRLLTLLTYADISAVNPTVMTPWRAEQLWQLYLVVYNELTRELETERIEAMPSGPPERIEFIQGFPTRYLRTHTEAEIDEHVKLRARSRPRGIAIDIRRLDSAWQLTLVAVDRPGLFASVAGTLASFGVNILKAEAFANRQGLVLDTFAFADPSRTFDLNPSELERLQTTLERVLSGKLSAADLLKNRPKPSIPSRKARIPGSVSFDNNAGQSATLIEIIAEDRPGLLYDLATAITNYGCNIEVVLIDTQAHKAIDVFYVTSAGEKLAEGKQAALGQALRGACGVANT